MRGARREEQGDGLPHPQSLTPGEGLLDLQQWGWKTLPGIRWQPATLSKHVTHGHNAAHPCPAFLQAEALGGTPTWPLVQLCCVFGCGHFQQKENQDLGSKTPAPVLHVKWGIKTVCTRWCAKQGGTRAT